MTCPPRPQWTLLRPLYGFSGTVNPNPSRSVSYIFQLFLINFFSRVTLVGFRVLTRNKTNTKIWFREDSTVIWTARSTGQILKKIEGPALAHTQNTVIKMAAEAEGGENTIQPQIVKVEVNI